MWACVVAVVGIVYYEFLNVRYDMPVIILLEFGVDLQTAGVDIYTESHTYYYIMQILQ